MQSKRPETGSSFYPAFFLLPKKRREALSAVYAFCRAVDDVADEPGGTPRQLDAWREEIAAVYAGAPRTEIGGRLARALSVAALPRAAFEAVIEGARMDLEPRRYQTAADLELYMYRVASAVGLLCIEIFGRRTASAEPYARQLGYAFQLTNILRDVDEDLARGRLYLPLEDLRRFGCSEGELKARAYSERFSALMGFEYQRARGYYDAARAALDPADRAAMLPAEVMAGVYETLLERIKRTGFRVFDGRIALSTGEKLRAAAAAWWRGRGAAPRTPARTAALAL